MHFTIQTHKKSINWLIFDSVRQSVSTQFGSSKKTRGWSFGNHWKKLATGAIELVVDAVVTPEGLATIMEGNTKGANKQTGSEIAEDHLDYNMYYVNLNRFHIDVVSTEDSSVLQLLFLHVPE